MVYPTTSSVRTQVVAAIRSTLAAIVAGGTYRSTMRKVLIGDVAAQVVEFPCAYIIPQTVTHTDSRSAMVEERMDLTVRVVSKQLGSGELANTGMEKISDLVEDVRIALLADHTLGGVAKDLHIPSDVTYVEYPSAPQHQADISVSVDYRHTRSLTGIDPGTAI